MVEVRKDGRNNVRAAFKDLTRQRKRQETPQPAEEQQGSSLAPAPISIAQAVRHDNGWWTEGVSFTLGTFIRRAFPVASGFLGCCQQQPARRMSNPSASQLAGNPASPFWVGEVRAILFK